jgi:hypothetical protein
MLHNLHLNSLWVSYSWSNLLDHMELVVTLKKKHGPWCPWNFWNVVTRLPTNGRTRYVFWGRSLWVGLLGSNVSEEDDSTKNQPLAMSRWLSIPFYAQNQPCTLLKWSRCPPNSTPSLHWRHSYGLMSTPFLRLGIMHGICALEGGWYKHQKSCVGVCTVQAPNTLKINISLCLRD